MQRDRSGGLFSFSRIELVHFSPCRCLAFLGVRSYQTIGETSLLNAEGESSESVIICLLAQLRVLFRKCKESILEAGVIGADRCPLVSLVEVYFCCFMRFLDACNHLFSKTSYFSVL